MRILKLFFKGFFLLLAVVCIAVLAIFWSPSLQHRLALRVLQQVGHKSALAQIDLSWNSLTLRGLSTQISGYGISLDALDLKARFLSFLGGKLMEVDTLNISGARVDLPKNESNALVNETKEKKASKKKDPEAIFEERDDSKSPHLLPFQVAVKSMKVDATVAWSDGPVFTANMTANGIVPGQKGSLAVVAHLTDAQSEQAQANFSMDIEQSAPTQARSLSVTGTLTASGNTQLLTLGDAFKSMSGRSHFSIHVTPQALDLTDLNIQVMNALGTHLLTAKLLSPLRIPLDFEGEWALKGLSGNVAELQMDRLDLELLKALFPKDCLVAGQIQPFTLTLNAVEGSLKGIITPAIALNHLDLTQAGAPVLKSLDMAIMPEVIMQSSKVTLNIPSMNLSTNSGGHSSMSWLSGNAFAVMDLNGGDDAFQGNVDLVVDLAKAKSQPVLSNLSQLEAATFELKAHFEADEDFSDIRFVCDTVGHSIQSSTAQEAIHCTIHAEGSLDANGVLELKIPVFLTGLAGQTDLNAAIHRNSSGAIFGSLKSRTLYVDDCMILADAFAVKSCDEKKTTVATASPHQTSTPAKTLVADRIPFWGNALNAEFKVQLDRIVQNRIALLETVELGLRVTPEQCSINPCIAKLTGAPLHSSWMLAFDPKKPNSPYDLKGAFDLKDLEVATLYKALEQTGRSPMTGRLNCTGEANAKGATLNDLLDHTQGQLTVNATGGTFYVLEAAGSAGRLSKGAGAIAGVLNAATGSKVGQIDTLSRLVQMLNKIDYNLLRIHAQRKSDLNWVLDDFTVEGPTLAIYGKGQVTHQANNPIANQPLNVQANLFAKGDTVSLLKDVRLLESDKPNAHGYFKGPTFTIAGTPANPDFSGLYDIISKAAIGVAKHRKTTEPSADKTSKPVDMTQQPVKQILKGLGSLF